MSYIGQAKLKKTKDGKAYNYGSSGRWSDHTSTAKKSGTPLSKAIREYGRDAFEITDLQIAEETELDACEAYWIEKENTLQPHGYNVMQHSRNKHNKESNLHTQYVGKVVVAELHPVNKEGAVDFFYVYMIMLDGSSKRITFGQNGYDTVEKAKVDALAFCEKLECKIEDFTEDSFKQQTRTLYALSGTIREVTIASASSLVAVYIMTSEMKLKKEQIRICFGGKWMSKRLAYQNALDYIKTLPLAEDTKINDKLQACLKSSQQAAALEDEVDLSGENSVTTSLGADSPSASEI